MFKIKQMPSDFVVKEVNNLEFDEKGGYSYYLLKKTNYNTVDAVKRVSDAFHIEEKYINFAGIKDRNAITEQYISINNGPRKDLSIKDIDLKFLGRGKERLNLGSLEKNYFEITVRNTKKLPKQRNIFINSFDDQRFGKEKNNHIIGKLILKRRYDEACKLIPETSEHLANSSKDFVGALRSIPKKVLKIYIHAYQSYLWNKAAEKISKTTKENIKIDIIGFGTEFKEKKIEKIYEKIMRDEEITFRDFINKSIPELSEEGTIRDLYVIPENLEVGKLEDDELNPGMKKVLVRFYLQPGSYATNIIKGLFR